MKGTAAGDVDQVRASPCYREDGAYVDLGYREDL
jgi:hypothetical protein